MSNPHEPVSTFNIRPFCLNYSELCNFKRDRHEQQFVCNIGKVKNSLFKVNSSGSIQSQGCKYQVFGLCLWAEK